MACRGDRKLKLKTLIGDRKKKLNTLVKHNLLDPSLMQEMVPGLMHHEESGGPLSWTR